MTNERGIKEMTEQLIDFRYIFAVILSFSVTAILGPCIIPLLRRRKVGNKVAKPARE